MSRSSERDMTLLVTGAGGQLGRCVLEVAASGLGPAAMVVRGLTRDALDITDADAVNAVMRRLRPTAVINTAAWTAVDAAENSPHHAMAVNALGAANVAAAAARYKARLVHISTDYVFDGSVRHPLIETAVANPANVYGDSKLAGEQAVQVEAPDAVIVRSAGLYSACGKNFVKAILHRGFDRGVLNVVDDQVTTPTFAMDLAHAVLQLARCDDVPAGIYHYAGSQAISWYALALRVIALAADHDPVWKRVQLHAVSTAEFAAAAPRPAYSALDCRKIQALGMPLYAPDQRLPGVVASLLGAGASA